MTTRHLIAPRSFGFCARPTALVLVLCGLGLGGGPALATEIEFDDVVLYFELNATDGDVGLQGLLDGDAWRMVRIVGPNGTEVLRANTSRRPNFGMTELFFESNEPLLEERSFADLLALFPEGDYHFRGRTIEGDLLVGSAELTDDLPCPALIEPQIAGPNVTITFELVPGVFDPDTDVCLNEAEGVEVVAVEVVVEAENEDTLRVFRVDLSPEATEVQVPRAFLDEVEALQEADPEGTEAKVEVVVIEESGNRTASEQELDL